MEQTVASFDGDIEATLDVTATLLTKLDSNFGTTIDSEAIGDIGYETEIIGIRSKTGCDGISCGNEDTCSG